MGIEQIFIDFIFYTIIGFAFVILPLFSFFVSDKLWWFPGKRIYKAQIYRFRDDIGDERIKELENDPDKLDIDRDLLLIDEKRIWRVKHKGVYWLWLGTFFIQGVRLDYHLMSCLVNQEKEATIRLLQTTPGVWREENLRPIDIPKYNPLKLTWKTYQGQVSAANREAIDATNEEIAKDEERDLLKEFGIPAMGMVFIIVLFLLNNMSMENISKAQVDGMRAYPEVFCKGYAQQQLERYQEEQKTNQTATFPSLGVLNITG